MKILISGAGIAGLALAGFLRKHSVDVDIIDRSHAFTHMGYGIILMPSGIRILHKLGIGNHIVAHGQIIQMITMFDRHGTIVQKEDLRPIAKQNGDFYTISRQVLHEMLEELVGDSRVQFNTTIESFYQHADKVNVSFSTGQKKTYDLLICADGVKSDIRKKVFHVNPTYYNFFTWISWLEKPVQDSNKLTIILGSGLYILYMPISASKQVAYLFLKHTPGEKEQEEDISKYFGHFEGLGREIMHGIKDPQKMFYDDIRKVHLTDWYKNRIVLMGDAEHAMTPLTGMGTSLALEDAFVLYDELLSVNFDNKFVHLALERYAKRRQPRVAALETFSDGLMNLAVKNNLISRVRDLVLKTEISREIISNGISQILLYTI